MKSVLQLGTGKMSVFGGPADDGCAVTDGLALIGPTDMAVWQFAVLFLPKALTGNDGMARSLNPRSLYCAMRWDEVLKPYGYAYADSRTVTMLRHAMVRLTNPATGACVFVRPVDYGPGDGKVVDGVTDPDTGRLTDLSPGAATALGLQTDGLVRCELILPEVES